MSIIVRFRGGSDLLVVRTNLCTGFVLSRYSPEPEVIITRRGTRMETTTSLRAFLLSSWVIATVVLELE